MLFNYIGQIFVKFAARKCLPEKNLLEDLCQKNSACQIFWQKWSARYFLLEDVCQKISARKILPEIIKNNSSRKFLPEIIKHILLEKLWQKLSARTFLPEFISRKFSARNYQTRKFLPQFCQKNNICC